MKKMFLIILLLGALSLILIYFIGPKSADGPKVMLNNTTNNTGVKSSNNNIESIVYEDALPSRDITITSYPSNVLFGENVSISWEYNSYLANFGDAITLCLVAFDSTNKIIDTRANNTDACYYRFGGTHSGYKLGDGSLQSKTYKGLLPKDISSYFLTEPAFYSIQIVFLDDRPKGTTLEWGGLVGYAETGKIFTK